MYFTTKTNWIIEAYPSKMSWSKLSKALFTFKNNPSSGGGASFELIRELRQFITANSVLGFFLKLNFPSESKSNLTN